MRREQNYFTKFDNGSYLTVVLAQTLTTTKVVDQTFWCSDSVRDYA